MILSFVNFISSLIHLVRNKSVENRASGTYSRTLVFKTFNIGNDKAPFLVTKALS